MWFDTMMESNQQQVKDVLSRRKPCREGFGTVLNDPIAGASDSGFDALTFVDI